jgi:hypothetical protein
LRNASTVWRQVATADGPQVPGTDSEGDLLAILAGPMVPGTDSGGGFASDPGGADGAWHPFRGGDLLAILAGPLVPGTDSKG